MNKSELAIFRLTNARAKWRGIGMSEKEIEDASKFHYEIIGILESLESVENCLAKVRSHHTCD